MALIGLGLRSISMAPSSIGPVKAMTCALDAGKVTGKVQALLDDSLNNQGNSIRAALADFAVAEDIPF